MGSCETIQPDLQQLRDEHALLGELLRVERSALADYMAYAGRMLARARIQLQRRFADNSPET